MGLPKPTDVLAITLGSAVALVAATAPQPAQAQQLLCCQVDGKKTCGDRLPSACVGKPYTIRGPGGKITQVEGMLTPEQRAQKEADAKRKQAEAEAQAEQKRKDRALLATYTSERDIDTARTRSENDIVKGIQQAEGKIAAAEKRRKKFDAEAEFYKGKEVPEEVRRAQKDADYEIQAQRELIKAKNKDLDIVREKFESEKRRYKELTQARGM